MANSDQSGSAPALAFGVASVRRAIDPGPQPVGRISHSRGEFLPWGTFTKKAPALQRLHAHADDFRDLFFIQEFHLLLNGPCAIAMFASDPRLRNSDSQGELAVPRILAPLNGVPSFMSDHAPRLAQLSGRVRGSQALQVRCRNRGSDHGGRLSATLSEFLASREHSAATMLSRLVTSEGMTAKS